MRFLSALEEDVMRIALTPIPDTIDPDEVKPSTRDEGEAADRLLAAGNIVLRHEGPHTFLRATDRGRLALLCRSVMRAEGLL